MKAVLNFPNYFITKTGRVWSVRSNKYLKLYFPGNKYPRIVLCKGGTRRPYFLHRLLLETFKGPCPKGMECRHLDGNPLNYKLSNLKWGTKKENSQDSIRHKTHSGFSKYGEHSSMSVLSDKDRRLILYQYVTGLFNQRGLGKLYDIHQSTISRLVSGILWSYVNVVKIMESSHAA